MFIVNICFQERTTGPAITELDREEEEEEKMEEQSATSTPKVSNKRPKVSFIGVCDGCMWGFYFLLISSY